MILNKNGFNYVRFFQLFNLLDKGLGLVLIPYPKKVFV